MAGRLYQFPKIFPASFSCSRFGKTTPCLCVFLVWGQMEMLFTGLSITPQAAGKSSGQLSPYHLPAARKTAVLWMCGSKARDSSVTSCHSAEGALLAVSTRGTAASLAPKQRRMCNLADSQQSLKPILPLWLLLVRSFTARERRDVGFVQ